MLCDTSRTNAVHFFSFVALSFNGMLGSPKKRGDLFNGMLGVQRNEVCFMWGFLFHRNKAFYKGMYKCK